MAGRATDRELDLAAHSAVRVYTPEQKETLLDSPATLSGDDVHRWLLPGLYRDRSSFFLHQVRAKTFLGSGPVFSNMKPV